MNASHSRRIVLLAEDSPIVRRTVEAELQAAGYEVLAYDDGVGVLRYLALGERADILVTDIDMPGVDGLCLANETRSSRPGIAVIYMSTRCPESETMVEGSSFVPKPFRIGTVTGAIRDAMAMAPA